MGQRLMKSRIACWVSILSLVLAVSSRAAESVVYELPPIVEATEVVPEAVRTSENYTVANDVSIADFYYQFKLQTTLFGEYDVTSLDLLKVRAYETNVLAGAPEIKGRASFGDAAKTDIKETAKATAKTVVTPVKSAKALGAGLEEQGRFVYDFIRFKSRNQPKDSLLTGEEKRRQAKALGIDVYSTNPAVQAHLERRAKARSPGSKLVDVGIGVTTFVMPFGMPVSLTISAGKFREKLADKFDSMSPLELYHYNDKILKKMGIQSAQREQFLEFEALSPRQKTEIIADLKTLDEMKDWQPFLDACRAAHPKEGLWQLQSSDMLAKFNKTVEPLSSAYGSDVVVVATTVTGRQIIFVPGDIVFWSEPLAKAFENPIKATGAVKHSAPQCIVAGRVTETAKKEIERRGFTVLDFFLRDEKQP